MELKLTYTVIQPKSEYSWEREPKIKSNLADDEFVTWKIAKSLSDELLKADENNKAEKILLEIAECERRNIECEIANMDDLALELQSKTDIIKATFDDAIEAQNKAIEDKREELFASIEIIEKKVKDGLSGLSNEVTKPFNETIQSIKNIDVYKLENFFSSMSKIIDLHNKNPKLLEFIVSNFKFEE